MKQYSGLVNEGATCYLNSLIQTLYMTPQFRKNIYKYVHDTRKISEVDSIPYQLQKLFVKLQLNDRAVYTKGLRRSFQWTDSESFQQHDVQQFCRILFEAVEKVFKGDNWIQRLYSGTVVSYISCGKHTRENPQIYLDLSLPIRNIATKVQYKSIEHCLKQYIRPQKLDDKIQCEQCGEKVESQKGMKFSVLPQILTLQLNRFELNYETFQRQKINTFVYYPQVLYMDKFLKPFQTLEISPLPTDIQQKTKIKAKQKSARTMQWGDLSIVGQGIKRKASDQIQTKKQKVKFLDQENRDKRQDITKQLSAQQQLNKNKQIMQQLKASKNTIEKKMEMFGTKDKTDNKQKQQAKNEQKTYDPIEDDMLFGTFMQGIPKNDPIPCSIGTTTETPIFQKTEATFEHEQQIFDINKQYPPNTYILYSILVHNGGAYGGHYYAYIFNGQNWFSFNDSSVNKVSRSQIRKYGHPSQNSSYGTNAYLLFYYQANKYKEDILNNKIQIPKQLQQKVQNDLVDITKQQVHHDHSVNQNTVVNRKSLFRVYWYGNKNQFQLTENDDKLKHEVIVVDDRYETTVGQLKQQIKEVYRDKLADIDNNNWQIRRYNYRQQSILESYGEQQNELSLDSVGLRQTCYIAIEIKQQNGQFQQFDPRNITIKLNIWRNNLTLLTQQYLKPKKMAFRQEKTFREFYHKVQEITGLKNPTIIKRTFSSGKSYQQFRFDTNSQKTLISLRFFNGINLYVQPQNTQSRRLLWDQQFESQRYRCLIKYNNPKIGTQKDCEIYFDTRKTLGDLKTALSQAINIPFQQFRIKKAQQAVSQMINYKKKLIDLRFVNNQILYLEEGKSSKGSLLIKRGFVALVDGQIDYTLAEQTLIQLDNNISTCADVKNILASKISIQPEFIRIRQYKAFQFGQIFQENQSVQKMKDKSLIWQKKQDGQTIRGIQYYVRVFDVINLQLGPLITIYVQNTANYEELTYILEQETQIQADKILAWRATSNFIDKSLLFEIDWHQIRFLPKPIREDPLYLNTDGQIIIVKQAETAYHAKPIRKTGEYPSSQFMKNSETDSYPKKKQAGMKITVVQEKQIEQYQEQNENIEEMQKQQKD